MTDCTHCPACASHLDRIAELEARLAAHKKDAKLNLHRVLTCGIIAEGNEHLNVIYQPGGKWDTDQAGRVRVVVAERDALKAEVARLREDYYRQATRFQAYGVWVYSTSPDVAARAVEYADNEERTKFGSTPADEAQEGSDDE